MKSELLKYCGWVSLKYENLKSPFLSQWVEMWQIIVVVTSPYQHHAYVSYGWEPDTFWTWFSWKRFHLFCRFEGHNSDSLDQYKDQDYLAVSLQPHYGLFRCQFFLTHTAYDVTSSKFYLLGVLGQIISGKLVMPKQLICDGYLRIISLRSWDWVNLACWINVPH